jgi:Cellulose binding domain
MLPLVVFGGQGGYAGEANSRSIINMITRRVRYTTCLAAAVLAIGGAGAAVALSTPAGSGHINADADYCGLVSCAALHAARHSRAGARAVALGDPADTQRPGPKPPPTSATPEPLASSPAPAHRPTKAPPGHTARPTAGPRPTPSPTPASPAVTVSYFTAQRWGGGFQGQFVITNHGTSAVTGWQIVITLSGDRVDTVWNADWQYGSGGSVIMTAAPYDQVIEPGASQSVNFVAQGSTTEPTSCTFDGSACS